MGIRGNGWLSMCIYSNEKVFIWCKCICSYSYGAFLWLKIVKNYQKYVYMGMGEVLLLET